MKLMYIKQRYIVILFKEIKGPKAVKKPFPATSCRPMSGLKLFIV